MNSQGTDSTFVKQMHSAKLPIHGPLVRTPPSPTHTHARKHARTHAHLQSGQDYLQDQVDNSVFISHSNMASATAGDVPTTKVYFDLSSGHKEKDQFCLFLPN